MPSPRDVHSYANPDRVRVRHADLDLDIRFDRRILEGSVTLTFERRDPGPATIDLDTRGLAIAGVDAPDGNGWKPVPFELGPADPILGAKLSVQAPAGVDRVRIHYATGTGASGLQWL